MLIRNIKPDLLKQLKEDKLFKDKLFNDIKKGSVFAALRNNRIDFYFKGGKLFSFNSNGLSTHIKYATTPEDAIGNYVTENKFSEKCGNSIKSFVSDYNKIKTNCELYSKGSEAAYVSYLYSKYSFANSATDIVVLDIEISLEADEDENRNQDRIDILLYSKSDRALKFVEAKLYTNKEIRSREDPEVLGQIERYNSQIKRKEVEICSAYKKYVGIMNDLFSLNIEKPVKVLPGAGLYIFDFDEDQRKGNLEKKIKPQLERKHIQFYSRGNPAKINIKTLWNATTKICKS